MGSGLGVLGFGVEGKYFSRTTLGPTLEDYSRRWMKMSRSVTSCIPGCRGRSRGHKVRVTHRDVLTLMACELGIQNLDLRTLLPINKDDCRGRLAAPKFLV